MRRRTGVFGADCDPSVESCPDAGADSGADSSSLPQCDDAHPELVPCVCPPGTVVHPTTHQCVTPASFCAPGQAWNAATGRCGAAAASGGGGGGVTYRPSASPAGMVRAGASNTPLFVLFGATIVGAAYMILRSEGRVR